MVLNWLTKGRNFKAAFEQENTKAASYLIIFMFLISIMVAQLPELFKNGKIENFNYIVSHEFITVGMMIGMSILIYSIIDKFLDSSDEKHKLKELKDKLDLVDSMLKTKGLSTIVTDDEITQVENNSDEIIIILNNLFLDLPKKYKNEFADTKDTFGSYFDPVHENMKAGKQYTYYLKYDNNTHYAINLHMKAHFYELEKKYKGIKEPKFILIPSNEFSFFSDIYIYKIYKDNVEKQKSAYQHLPTLTQKDEETKKETLFYLHFDQDQTTTLDNILTATEKKYGITLGTTLQKSKEYIVNASYISNIEEDATEIQIITDDLKDDLEDGLFFNPVRENIKAGKQYTYFLPDNKAIRLMIEQYKIDHKLHEKNNGSVIFKCIPDNVFFFFNNVYIYDKKSAFEFMPVSNMYFKYEDKQLDKLLSNIKSLEISLKKEVQFD